MQFKRKTGNRFRKLDEKSWFREQKMPCYREFIWSAVFFKYCIQTLQCIYLYCCQLAWAVFYSQEWCLSQEALDEGALAAQAANNWCRWYSLLRPGHTPHFFSHWKSFKISSSIFTKHLVKYCREKKNRWCNGRLWRPKWTDWLKIEPSLKVRSFLESKNVINLKSWHSMSSLKIGEILTMARFLYPLLYMRNILFYFYQCIITYNI